MWSATCTASRSLNQISFGTFDMEDEGIADDATHLLSGLRAELLMYRVSNMDDQGSVVPLGAFTHVFVTVFQTTVFHILSPRFLRCGRRD